MTNLVALAHSTETRTPHARFHGIPPHDILVHLRNVVILILQLLARRIFALARDLADARDRLEDVFKVIVGQLGFSIVENLFVGLVFLSGSSSLEFRWEVAVDD